MSYVYMQKMDYSIVREVSSLKEAEYILLYSRI